MESVHKFRNSLRWSAPRILESVPDEAPSLRARALLQVRKSKSATASRNLRSSSASLTSTWEQKFSDEVEVFAKLASQVRLPALEFEMYQKHFVRDASISNLPAIQQLNTILRRVVDYVEDITECIEAREELLASLACTCGAGGKGTSRCTTDSHEQTCILLREIDDHTLQLIQLINQWRSLLNHPLPFFYQEENYLMKMYMQYQPGSAVNVVGSHLRATCRHMPFFYGSPFDAIAEGRVTNRAQRDILSLWREVVVAEPDVQEDFIAAQYENARMGLLIPMLRWKRTVLTGKAPPDMIHITDKVIKTKLMQCYTSAAVMLKRVRPKTSSGSVAAFAQLATFSTKALHLQYYRKWIEWISRKRDRRSMALALYDIVRKQHMRMRFNDLQRFTYKAKEARKKWLPLCGKNQMVLLRRFVSRWFLQDRMRRLTRSVRRALFLQYYRAFHLKVVHTRLARQRMIESGHTAQECYPVTHDAMKFVALTGGAAVPYLNCVWKAQQIYLPAQNCQYKEHRLRLELRCAERAGRTSIWLENWEAMHLYAAEVRLKQFCTNNHIDPPEFGRTSEEAKETKITVQVPEVKVQQNITQLFADVPFVE